MSELPPAGWYDDPTSPVQERWWDGEKWSEQTRRKVVEVYQHRPSELRRISDYLGHAFGLIRERWDDFLLVGAIGAILTAIVAVALLRPVIAAIDIVNDELVGFEFAQFGQVFFFVVLVTLIGAATTLAQYRIAWEAATEVTGTWSSVLAYGFANLPRLIAWGLLGFLPVIGGFVLVAVLASADSFIAVFAFFVAFFAFMWWMMILIFIPIALVALPPPSNPIRVALGIVKGRWWRIFGRMLLLGIIVGLVVQVIGAFLAQIAGTNFLGFDLVDAGGGRIDIVKNLGSNLEFFVGSLVYGLLSYVGNSGQVVGLASIAFDVLPRPEDQDESVAAPEIEPY